MMQEFARRLAKNTYQFLTWSPRRPRRILFVVGCQRSGTTLMQEIFERERNAKIYPERSVLTSRDLAARIRLNPLPDVKRVLDRDFARLIVLKPLVETQRVRELLQFFSRSRAIFLYRHFADVAASDLKRFGADSGIRNIRAIVENEPGNWRAERASPQVRSLLAQHFSPSMNPHDAAALFWYARNALFFELDLTAHRDVMLCKYEELAEHPLAVMQRIYNFAGVYFKVSPGIVRSVHADSLKKGQGIALSPPVQALCEGMLFDLDAVHGQQSQVLR